MADSVAAKLPREKCISSGPRMVTATGRITVYVRRGRPRQSATYLACDRRTGKVVGLGLEGVGNIPSSSESVLKVVANGPNVVLSVQKNSQQLGAVNVLRAFDVPRGLAYLEDALQYQDALLGAGHVAPTSLEVARDGDVAWISTYPGGPQVDVFFARREAAYRTSVPTLLDQGADVVPSSLAIGASDVYWQRGGAKSVPR